MRFVSEAFSYIRRKPKAFLKYHFSSVITKIFSDEEFFSAELKYLRRSRVS